MRNILILFVLLGFQFLDAQRNCNMYPEGSPCREACETGSLASRYPQGSRKTWSFIQRLHKMSKLCTCMGAIKCAIFKERRLFKLEADD